MAFASQDEAFRALAAGEAELSDKFFLEGDGTVPTVFAYGARASLTGPACVRVACVGGLDNHRRGLPELDAVIVVTDAETGLVRALVDGVAFTLIRTAAAAAVAVEHLARRDACRLALFGSGPQADACALAIARVRHLTSVAVWSPRPARRAAAAERIRAGLDSGATVRVATSASDALAGADMIVAVTNSATPVFPGDHVEAGALVVSMGSFRPDRCEVDDRLMDRAAAVVVDHRPVALETAGPVIRWSQRHPSAQLLALGDVINGAQARRADREIVFFNSVGLGVQDATATRTLLDRVDRLGLGTTVGSLSSLGGAG
jgi:ornithine cyclodeaminase